MKKSISIFFLLFSASSCVKDKPQAISQAEVQLTNSKKVYVVNEGPFQGINTSGTISLYDPGNEAVIENFYQVQNQEQIGNIAQSLNFINGSYYIVANNANKIIVCDNQFKKTGQINNLRSPRYILPVTNRKAYVTDLYADAISIIDLNTNTKTGSIKCAGKTEKLVSFYNKVFITNTDRNYLYVIDALKDEIVDSVFVGLNAGSIVMDKNDRLWVLGSGNSPSSVGRLSRIDPVTNALETFFAFSNGELPINLCLNKAKDILYFLNDGIFKMAITEINLPGNAFIPKGTKNFYGLGINPNDQSIYAADALDYSQRSQVYIYNADGSLRTSFKAGVISNSFYFE